MTLELSERLSVTLQQQPLMEFKNMTDAELGRFAIQNSRRLSRCVNMSSLPITLAMLSSSSATTSVWLDFGARKSLGIKFKRAMCGWRTVDLTESLVSTAELKDDFETWEAFNRVARIRDVLQLLPHIARREPLGAAELGHGLRPYVEAVSDQLSKLTAIQLMLGLTFEARRRFLALGRLAESSATYVAKGMTIGGEYLGDGELTCVARQ